MNPDEFNALPLAEKKQHVAPGDIVVTDSGARLPVSRTDNTSYPACMAITEADELWVSPNRITNIIRPDDAAGSVPDTASLLRNRINAMAGPGADLIGLVNCILIIADHIEKESRK